MKEDISLTRTHLNRCKAAAREYSGMRQYEDWATEIRRIETLEPLVERPEEFWDRVEQGRKEGW